METKGIWSGLRRMNERGVGWLANPVVMFVILDIIIYAVLSFFTGSIVPKAGTLLLLVGILLVGAIRGTWGILSGLILTIVGAALLYANVVLHVISF